MKNFLWGLSCSILASVITFFITTYFSRPIITYRLYTSGSDVNLKLENSGLISADWVSIEVGLLNRIKEKPIIKKRYWTTEGEISNFISVKNVDGGSVFKFEDSKCKLGKLERKEEFHILLESEDKIQPNSIQGRRLDIRKMTNAILIPYEDKDAFILSLYFAILIFLVAYSGYLLLISLIISKKNKIK